MKVGLVNVGTVGQVDHGCTTLTSALASLGHEVIELTAEDVANSRELERIHGEMIVLSPVDFYSEPVVPYHAEHGRYRDPARKAERKARMRDAQRRAFEGS